MIEEVIPRLGMPLQDRRSHSMIDGVTGRSEDSLRLRRYSKRVVIVWWSHTETQWQRRRQAEWPRDRSGYTFRRHGAALDFVADIYGRGDVFLNQYTFLATVSVHRLTLNNLDVVPWRAVKQLGTQIVLWGRIHLSPFSRPLFDDDGRNVGHGGGDLWRRIHPPTPTGCPLTPGRNVADVFV